MAKTFTSFQQQAIDADGRDICVAAGAGSGKTGVLVERYVRLLVQSRDGVLPPERRAGVEEILVITFTEKATREMKTRIVAELTRLGLTEERRKVESAYISTIHGFCSRLLQENPFEVGIDPHFSVLDESQAKRLLRRTIDQVIEKAYETDDREVTELVALAQNSRQAGEDGNDPVFPLASSVESVLGRLRGAGVTRQDMERRHSEGVEATRDRSEQVVWYLLKPVLNELSACMEGLREISSGLIGGARTSADALLAHSSALARSYGPVEDTLAALREMDQVARRARTRVSGASTTEMTLVNLIGKIKAVCDEFGTLFKPGAADEEQAALACHRMWGLTAAVWKAYEQAKRAQGRVDNDDLQAEGVRLLEESAEVRDRYRRRLRYLMVDEFQDTSPLQLRLIELLHQPVSNSDPEPVFAPDTAAIRIDPPAPNFLFVVGDVQQSIYGFRSAEPGLFRSLERRYREENAGLHVPLAVNFRSRPEILRLISQLFRQIWRESETPFVPLECGAPFDEKPVPSLEFLLTQDLMRRDYIALEPEALARRVRRMVEGEELRITSHADPRRGEPIRYRDVVVLLRQLTDIQRYEEAFARQGVPYFVVGGGRGYYARQEIRDLRNILIVLDMPMNDVALMAALRSPLVGADTDTLYQIVREAENRQDTDATEASDSVPPGEKRAKPQALPLYLAVKHLLASGKLPAEEAAKISSFIEVVDVMREQEDRMPVGHLLERLIMQTRYDARLLSRPGGRRRLANVRKLLQMANSDSVMGVREFIRRLQDLEKLSDREGDAPTEEEAADVVRFHTIHGAKGLEFPVVILADLCRSLEFPERGLFTCDPARGALGTRLCGDADLVYRAIDRQRQAADREEAERLLYVAMTRAREHLIFCGNLGRNRGYNWGDRLFGALGILEIPDTPVTVSLMGGQQARCAAMAHYFHSGTTGEAANHRPGYREAEARADRLAQALLNGEPPDFL